MPKEITIMTYEFDELSDEAKEKALEWARQDLSFDDVDADFLSEDMKENSMAEAGIVGPIPYWRLSYSQGDGVAFYGKLDINVLMEKHPLIKTKVEALNKLGVEYIDIKIVDVNHHYHHYNSMDVDVDTDNVYLNDKFDSNDAYQKAYAKAIDDSDELIADITEYVLSLCRELSKKLEKIGYKHIEEHNSDENLIENIEANEYRFTKDGNRLVAL